MGRRYMSQKDIIEDIRKNNAGYKYRTIGRYGRYYVPIDDSTFIFLDLLMYLTSLGICIVGLYIVFSYKPIIIDPLENTKNLLLFLHLVLIMIISIVYYTFYIKVVKKNEFSLVKVLVILTIVSVVALLILVGIRLELDSSYLKIGFEQMKTGNLFKKNIEGVISNMEEYYHSEYLMFYDIFKLKSSIMFGIHLLLNIFLITKTSKLTKMKRKQDKIKKSDDVLFDKEENIKF